MRVLLLAGDRRVTAGVLKNARRIWEVGVACWPVTGRRRGGGVLCITEAAWSAGFQWWRSGDIDIMRTQNVSECMLVLALCLVVLSYKSDHTDVDSELPVEFLARRV